MGSFREYLNQKNNSNSNVNVYKNNSSFMEYHNKRNKEREDKRKEEEERRKREEQQKIEQEQKKQELLKEMKNNISTSPVDNKKNETTLKLAPVNNEPLKSTENLGELQKVTSSDIKAQKQAEKINRDLKNGDNASAIGAILNGIPEGIKSGVAKSINDFHEENTAPVVKNLFLGLGKGLMHYAESGVSAIDRTYQDRDKMMDIMTANTNKIRAEKGYEPLPTAEESRKIILGDSYNKDLFGRDKEEQQKKWDGKKKEIDTKIASNIENTDSVVGKKLVELAPSIGNQLPGFLLPRGAGLVYFTGSAKGAYMEDAKARGMSEEDVNVYSGIMALGEGFTDMIGAGITKGVGKNIVKENTKDALKLFGLDIFENAVEEAIMEPISEATATITGGKETADWSNMGKRMLNSGINGGLSAVIMAGTSAGVGKAVQLTNKMNNGEQVSAQEVAEAVKETLESDKVNQEELKEIIKENTNEIIKAELHNNSQLDGKGNILKLKVKAKDILWGGDDINEFGYFPDNNKYSQNNSIWQEYLNKNYKNTGRGEAIKDVKLAPVKNNVAPSMGNYEVQRKQKKIMNPTEISNLKLDDANTTPELKNRKYESGNKQSSFFSNIVTDAKFLNEDLRQEMAKEDNIRYYSGITNAETLEKAYNSLKEGGEKETLNWFSKNEKNISAEDVTKGWILLKQYQDAGDYQGAVEVAKKMRQMGTSAGQAVQAYNIMARMSPEGMFYYAQSELNEAFNKMIEGKSKQWIEKNQDKFTLTPEETQTIIDTMKEVGEMEDGREKTVKLAEIQKLVSDKIPPSAGQSIKAWMRISMLFNPKTQVRNVMGNSVVLPVNATADVFSGAMDKLISKKTGVRTTGVTKEGIKGYAKGFGKGLFESYDDFRKGINTRNVEGNRFEIGEGKSFKDKGLGKALNRVDSLLSFSLDAGDRGFYEASFTNSINNQLVLNNTTEVTQDMIDIATQEALQRTWQDDNSYTQTVLSIRKNLNKLNVKGYGLGDVLIPFAKTPANLTKAIVDYSPVGLAKTLALDARKFNNSLSNGQYSPQLQHKFVQNLGKGMAGSLLYVLGYGLAKAGIATGESDDDKDVKNFMKNSLGIGSYSIKVGDKSFSYDWAQPVATPLAIMTNYVKYSKDNPDASAINKAIKSLDIGTEQLLQQSFMESLNTVLNGTGTTMENLSKAILDLPARSIPTFSKQIADMVDETQRTTFEYGKPVQSAINSVISKIPFASKSLPASVDTLGHEVKKYGGNNNLWNVMFNPANTNKGQLSKAGKEIYDVYMQTGDTTIFPRTAPYYINSKGEKVNMTSQERNQFQRVTGKYVENSLNSLMKDADYKKLSNDKKAEIINEIVSDSYSKAKYDVLKIDSKEYEKKRNTLKDVKPSSYYNYKFKTEGMKKDNEKINVLVNANYTDKEKTAIYENYILSSTNTTYPLLKKSGIDIDEYMKYLQQDFKSDKKDNGTTSGKTVAGSAKRKTYEYVNNMNISYEQKLLLLGTQYKLNDTERTKLYNYVKTLDYSQEEMQKVFEKLQGFTVYKDGRVTW